ncbi:hypothetical protein FWF74_01750 [Candidatus Saccharibacteria bacterium]|nr:hypothetical protein [Candidatus Saccharibacteria bacterium]MCL1963188.1 hypothetical protein [Candidatus Saccharibacteria bacterium]
MYSGTIFRKSSGKIAGTHQKIDRVARRKLQPYIPSVVHFPASREIVKFEGLNGPDGIKKKSPGQDEPRHFIDPTNPQDRRILDLIKGHENNLITALTENNRERAAFEAAWLAHAIVDGLTPAHHYPYEEKLAAILGDDIDTRDSKLKKFIMPGDTMRKKFVNNWEYWKPNGLMTAHGLFEIGVAMVTTPLRFKKLKLPLHDRAKIRGSDGITSIYLDFVQKIHDLKMYDEFLNQGWTVGLARKTRTILMPTIIRAVWLSWYYCAWRAGQNIREK